MKDTTYISLRVSTGLALSTALLVLIFSGAGCGDPGGGEDGESFDLCRADQPTCYADCSGSSTLEPECVQEQWQCPDGTVDPDGPECADESCEPDPPSKMCTPSCDGDVYRTPECDAGEWTCPDGTVDVETCPDDSCPGRPEGCVTACVEEWESPAPVCEDRQWTCVDSVFQSECSGTPCTVESTSTLPGVEMNLQVDTCGWTLAEVRDGFTIDYTIEVQDAVEVRPRAQDAGGCGSSVHPLDPFYEFHGHLQRHCRCDVGLCAGHEEFNTLEPGTYTGTIEWSGRNWLGPSDTENEPGDYFPPDQYTLEVTAIGAYRDSAGEVQDYRVRTAVEFELLD